MMKNRNYFYTLEDGLKNIEVGQIFAPLEKRLFTGNPNFRVMWYMATPTSDVNYFQWAFGKALKLGFTSGTPNKITQMTDEQNSAEANVLFVKYICPTYMKQTIFETFEKIDGETMSTQEMNDEFAKFCKNYLGIFNNTCTSYLTLIKIYEDEKANLMNAVSITTLSKFNETPQNSITSYSFNDDLHITSANTTEQKNQVNTTMARIKEIEDNISNVYAKWAKEFECLFWYN